MSNTDEALTKLNKFTTRLFIAVVCAFFLTILIFVFVQPSSVVTVEDVLAAEEVCKKNNMTPKREVNAFNEVKWVYCVGADGGMIRANTPQKGR